MSAPVEIQEQESGPHEISSAARESLRRRLRVTYALCLGILLAGDVVLYSLYKGVESQLESQERRVDRMGRLLADLLGSRDNAQKIEEIEQQVEGVAVAVEDLQHLVTETRPDLKLKNRNKR